MIAAKKGKSEKEIAQHVEKQTNNCATCCQREKKWLRQHTREMVKYGHDLFMVWPETCLYMKIASVLDVWKNSAIVHEYKG